MLLSECASSLSYPLAWSRNAQITALFVLNSMAASALLLHRYDELVVLIWLGVWRSYVIWRRNVQVLALMSVQVEPGRGVRLRQSGQYDEQATRPLQGREEDVLYQIETAIGMPGFGRLCLIAPSGKPLEVLIFYRYDARLTYWRVMRYGYLQSAFQNYD